MVAALTSESQDNFMSTRPLSPHTTIYRFMHTMVLSITHRITGVALSAGLLLLAYWLMAAARGPESYGQAQLLLGQFWVKLLLAGWLFAFVYHLCNGIRHLIWDTGRSLEKADARRSAVLVIAAVLLLFAYFLWRAFFSGVAS
jgi:succinate dehydrogenase / fumarate reductase, cytochrome b subunit